MAARRLGETEIAQELLNYGAKEHLVSLSHVVKCIHNRT